MPSHARSGCCGWCGRWLGALSEPPLARGQGDEATLAWLTWVADVLGALLAATPTLAMLPQVTDGAATCGACTTRIGGVRRLVRLLATPAKRVSEWRAGRTTPSLPTQLYLCYRLGTIPPQLATAPPMQLTPMTDVPAGRHRVCCRSGAARLDVVRARELMRKALYESEEPPPSLMQLVRRLSCGSQTLQYHLPEEDRAIAARFRAHRAQRGHASTDRRSAEVWEASLQLHVQGIVPTCHRVGARLTRASYLRDREAVRIFDEVRWELGYEARPASRRETGT